MFQKRDCTPGGLILAFAAIVSLGLILWRAERLGVLPGDCTASQSSDQVASVEPERAKNSRMSKVT